MLQSILHWLGFGLCHQLPERSFFGGGVQLPVCARDTGIYIGFCVGLALIAYLHRGERPSEFPTRLGWAAFALMLGSMALDGTTEYAGLRPTTNELRLITGLLSGYAIAMLLVPMLNDCAWTSSTHRPVLDPPSRLGVWLATVPVMYVVIWWGAPLLGVVYPIITSLAILVTLVSVNLVLVCVTPWFERRASRLLDLAAPAGIALVLSVMEIAGAALLRAWLVALATRLP